MSGISKLQPASQIQPMTPFRLAQKATLSIMKK